MERFHTHIGSLDRSFQERPEILKPVRVNSPIDVFLGVVDHLVSIFIEVIVGLQRIGIERSIGFNVLSDFGVKVLLAARAHNGGANFASLAFEEAKYNRLAHRSTSVNL